MASNTSGGVYKYNFLAEPDSALQCVICLEIAEEPWQHSKCGRLLCKECLEKYGRHKPCPNCRRERPQYFEDNRSMREIMALPITCNVSMECEWDGTVGALEKHVATCKFALVPCPKQCMSNNSKVDDIMRKDLDEHLKKHCPNRDYTCQYCGEKGTYANITQIHDVTCEKKLLPCPNAGCGDTVERQQVTEHVSKCPHTVISCKYEGIGCDVELERKDMAAHEQDDKLHLHMALDTVNSQQVAIGSLQSTTNFLQDNVKLLQDKLKNKEIVTFAVSEYQKKKVNNLSFTPPTFYTHPQGYHMVVDVFPNGHGDSKGTHVAVLSFVHKAKCDAGLKWPFAGRVTITLLNQLEDDNHCSIVISEFTPIDPNTEAELKFIPHHKLAHDPLKNTQYLKDDTLYFRVSVQVTDHKPWLLCTTAE